MGKIYVFFVGRQSGIYDTWIEASRQVNGFKGAIHQSFKNREEAEKAYQAHLDKNSTPISFTLSGNESSCATPGSLSSSNSRRSQSEKICKLKDALEEIKQQLDSLQISDDD